MRNSIKRIALIACASKKAPYPARARVLYTSSLFAGSLRYAQSLRPDDIFILSAKYGLLELDRTIEPYNLTLKDMPAAQVKAWARRVLEQLSHYADLKRDHFIILAGAHYRKYLTPAMTSYEVPLGRTSALSLSAWTTKRAGLNGNPG